jgi:hypothetical protein
MILRSNTAFTATNKTIYKAYQRAFNIKVWFKYSSLVHWYYTHDSKQFLSLTTQNNFFTFTRELDGVISNSLSKKFMTHFFSKCGWQLACWLRQLLWDYCYRVTSRGISWCDDWSMWYQKILIITTRMQVWTVKEIVLVILIVP